MSVVKSYGDFLDEIFKTYGGTINSTNIATLDFNETDSYEQIVDGMNAKLHELITKTGLKYNLRLPLRFRNEYPDIFLPLDAPQELQERFYERTIDGDFLKNNPEYLNHLKYLDVEAVFRHIPTWYEKNFTNYLGENEVRIGAANLISYIKEKFGNPLAFVILSTYIKHFEVLNTNEDYTIFGVDATPEEVLSKLEELIYNGIQKGQIMYDDNMLDHFKGNYPNLFLPDYAPNEIKEKFYARKFTAQDFEKNPELMNYFTNTDIACGFSPINSWLIGQLNDRPNANQDKLKILAVHDKINDAPLQEVFREYVLNNANEINMESLDLAGDLLFRLSYSNSSEMLAFRSELAHQLLKAPDPINNLNKIEDIFLRNNIPVVGKVFSVFQILHPKCDGFDFSDESTLSPVLKSKKARGREVTIFADLLRATLGSNNRSMKAYIDSIEKGNELLVRINNEGLKVADLSSADKSILSTFSNHLNTLYNNTHRGKGKAHVLSGDLDKDIAELIVLFSPNGNLDYDLSDRIVKMFAHFAGFDTLESMKNYSEQKIETTDNKNRAAAASSFKLERGDFLKGINNINYLNNILQNGSVSKEFLGASAGSDFTPLDTDMSRIMDVGSSMEETINKTAASSYGPIWLVLKSDKRFNITRQSPAEEQSAVNLDAKPGQYEAFYTGVTGEDHYGIRTGFPSSEIDYIVTSSYDARIGLEIAKNGFYIPVVDKTGKIVFSSNDYDLLRAKMAGLSLYEMSTYGVSDNLVSPEVTELALQIEENDLETSKKRTAINNVLEKALANFNLKLKNTIDGDLSEGSVELMDTGSTGRGTNMPGDGDFDFMMRMDKKLFTNPEKMDQIRAELLTALGRDVSEVIADGNFRLKDVAIEGLDSLVDIDISFVEKTDKLSYSTEMSLEDRLTSIKEQHPGEYQLIVANVLLAKKTLEGEGVYKADRGDEPQGGLGGVGIETWILQNGGSFYDAAQSFLAASEGKTFDEFKESYYVWDFGENHFASKKGCWPQDNFVEDNRREEKYQKMQEVLIKYIKSIEQLQSMGMQK
jgi:hypothetical protein